MKYVGVTDNPEEAQKEHGFPADWLLERFESAAAAEAWKKRLALRIGHTAGPDDEKGRYGFTYTVKPRLS